MPMLALDGVFSNAGGLAAGGLNASTPFDDYAVVRVRRIEWPTLALAVGIYAAWGLATFAYSRVSLWVFVPVSIWLVAWQSSLQHEILHGHPTRSRRFNLLLGTIPLSLWLPFERYRSTHLSHHRDERLTDPLDDPESSYCLPANWEAAHPLTRLCLRAQTTFSGKLVLGPAWKVPRFLMGEARLILSDAPGVRRAWLHHALALAPLVAWLTLVCRIDLGFYALAVVYPATSLLIVRSFAEHRAAEGVSERTAIVENAGLFGFLFLYNNLHAAHHEQPTLPWYRLPRWYRDNRDRLIEKNGGLLYQGYGDVAKRFLLSAHDRPDHPFVR